MDAESLGILFRGIERLFIVVMGGFSLWIGWNLFRHGITTMQKAEFDGGGFIFKAAKVSPGIFFALFGSLVLITCISLPFSSQRLNGSLSSASSTKQDNSSTTRIAYFQNQNSDYNKRIVQSIANINRISALLSKGHKMSKLEEEAFSDSASCLAEFRYKIMVSVFGKDFDDYRTSKNQDRNGDGFTDERRRIFSIIDTWESAP